MTNYPFSMKSLPVVLVYCAMLGCGGSTDRSAVSGTVTVDGAPLAHGAIQFVPTEGTAGPVAGAVIHNGEYSVPSVKGPVVGKHRVEITGMRPTGRKLKNPTGAPVDELVVAVSPRFNTASTLLRDVAPGNNVFDFEVSGPTK